MKLKITLNSKFIFIVFIVFVGCKTQYVANKIYYSNDEELIEVSKNLSLRSICKIDFSGNIQENGKDYKLNGFIKIKSADTFQIFVFSKTYGVEIGRLECNNDQITFIDKMNKLYYKGDISTFKFLAGTDLNSSDFLRVLLGRLFPSVQLVNTDSSNVFNYLRNQFNNTVTLNNFGYLYSQVIVNEMVNIKIEYSNYSKKSTFPGSINGIFANRKQNFSFHIDFTKVTEKAVNFDAIVIPKSFSVIL